MTTSDRESAVLEAVVSLVDSLLDDFDIVELLTDLVNRCVSLLDVASAGLLLSGPARHLRVMAATSQRTRDLEVFQLQRDEGPCLECYVSGELVSVPDLSDEAVRWPEFVTAALELGFVSVHAIPMRAGNVVLGTVGLFGTSRGPLLRADVAVAQTLAHIAAVAIVQERPPTLDLVMPRLVTALADRIVVEQAQGLLRQQLGLELDDAFDLLRRYAQTSHVHLSVIARQLVTDPASRDSVIAKIQELGAHPS